MEKWILLLHTVNKQGKKFHVHVTFDSHLECVRYLGAFKPKRGHELFYYNVSKEMVLL